MTRREHDAAGPVEVVIYLGCGKSPDTRPATEADKPTHGNAGSIYHPPITTAERAAMAAD